MLIKGAAVLAHTDWKVARRPMDDLDVAIPRARAPQAIDVLRGLGFASALAGDPRQLDERHALPFRDPSGAELDLHWHVLHSSLHHDADTEFWAAAEDAEVRGVACRVLCREDALLQACTQGREYSDTHPLRWAADALPSCCGASIASAGTAWWSRRGGTAWAGELREALMALAEVTVGAGAGATREDVGACAAPRGVRRRRAAATDPRRAGAGRAGRAGCGARSPPARRCGRSTPRCFSRTRGRCRVCGRSRCAARSRTRRRRARSRFGAATRSASATARPASRPRPGPWAPDPHGTWSRAREAVWRCRWPNATTGRSRSRSTLSRSSRRRDRIWRRASPGSAGALGTTLADTRRVVRVPAQTGRERIALRLQIRHPLSPLAARYDGDPRPLGVALLGLALGARPPAPCRRPGSCRGRGGRPPAASLALVTWASSPAWPTWNAAAAIWAISPRSSARLADALGRLADGSPSSSRWSAT